jgi:hypothetical protein
VAKHLGELTLRRYKRVEVAGSTRNWAAFFIPCKAVRDAWRRSKSPARLCGEKIGSRVGDSVGPCHDQRVAARLLLEDSIDVTERLHLGQVVSRF